MAIYIYRCADGHETEVYRRMAQMDESPPCTSCEAPTIRIPVLGGSNGPTVITRETHRRARHGMIRERLLNSPVRDPDRSPRTFIPKK